MKNFEIKEISNKTQIINEINLLEDLNKRLKMLELKNGERYPD